MFGGDRPRDEYGGVMRYLISLGEELLERQEAAELAIRTMGITFTVYAEAGDIDRAWPFDVIPRVISAQEWAKITAGLVQRLTAINLFVDDLYGVAKIVKDGVVPGDLIYASPNFRPKCEGVQPQLGFWLPGPISQLQAGLHPPGKPSPAAAAVTTRRAAAQGANLAT